MDTYVCECICCCITDWVRFLKIKFVRFEFCTVLLLLLLRHYSLFSDSCFFLSFFSGVLQHGALCAREYGKPAVSNIDIHTLLKDGMTVSVDGNTGIVKILKENDDDDEGEKEEGQ